MRAFRGRWRLKRIALVGPVAILATGCITTLGYVPEAVKAKKDAETLRPSYSEVKRWASKVADGYDSRSTMNRHAIYAGATLAAASVSAIAGLAAFGTGSSALIGIPIGSGFLGALAGVYQSDEKAAIYGHGARYGKALIVLSEERIQNFDEDVDGALRVVESEKAEAVARARLQHDKDQYTEQMKLATAASNKADTMKTRPADDPERVAVEKSAQALKELASERQQTVAVAEAGVRTAAARVKAAVRYQGLRKTAASDARKLFLGAQAVCLQQDFNTLMAKVADHVAVLDPKDLATRLKAIKAEPKPGNGETDAGQDQTTEKPVVALIPPPDLSDLTLPAKSSCIH